MPLPPVAPKEHLHTREIEWRGYRREDDLWDIEGRLVDTKTYGFFSNAWGDVKPGQPVHGMSIRVTVNDELVIHEASAAWITHPIRYAARRPLLSTS